MVVIHRRVINCGFLSAFHAYFSGMSTLRMFDPDSLIPKADRFNLESDSLRMQELGQRRKTAAALVVLLFVLGLVLYRHRDFWFAEMPDLGQAANATSETGAVVVAKKRHGAKSQASQIGRAHV